MYEPRPIEMDRMRAVLFDLDGTLIESDDRWVEKIAARIGFLRRLHHAIDPEVIARWLVMRVETPSNYALSAIEHLGLKTSFFGLSDRLRRARGLATQDNSRTVAGSEQLLRALEHRYRLAVVTTRARPEALAFLERSGLRSFFEIVITRQDVLRMKPHPEPVRTAARKLGVLANQCLMIGDTVNDVLAARRAGAFAIGVLSGFGERPELERSGADLILPCAADLLAEPIWPTPLQ
ncbi:MAG: HAD family hydrolase [Chloroflexi bacterium]|nr:HAD family hydrolase [Chloroflexota bacterium]